GRLHRHRNSPRETHRMKTLTITTSFSETDTFTYTNPVPISPSHSSSNFVHVRFNRAANLREDLNGVLTSFGSQHPRAPHSQRVGRSLERRPTYCAESERTSW